ncbi:MAG: choice-of-anchor D domain-containing protein [Archangiaceae bacterium]|nr:choice-of-anchor D domain-containing protein [Archangiaceae bacterium]
MSRPLLAVSLLLVACGRSSTYQPADQKPDPPRPMTGPCALEVSHALLDFGSVVPNLRKTLNLELTNRGDTACHLTRLSGADRDGFSRPAPVMTAVDIAPLATARLGVSFAVSAAAAPFDHTGTFSFVSDDPMHPKVEVALRAHLPHCGLRLASPATVTFAPLRPGQSDVRVTTVTNDGDADCNVTQVALDGDSSFTLGQGGAPFRLEPHTGHETFVGFRAPLALPAKRETVLRLTVTELAQPVEVPHLATVQRCALRASPNPFDFGNVTLNTTATHTLALFNDGSETCVASGFVLTADPAFSLPVLPGTLTIAPGGSGSVLIRFAAFDSAPPHQRTGTLRFSVNDPAQPQATVPISAFINSICTEAGQFIYTVDRNGIFSRFDPATLTSTAVGTLSCMNTTSPFSMNLDQSAVAWVVFDDGKLFKVDVGTAACTPTSFVAGQQGWLGFGMGSVFDSATGKDTLYIAGGPTDMDLGTLDLSTLTLTKLTEIEAPRAELAGTGDGQLWAFSPAFATVNNVPLLVRLDRADGGTLERHSLPNVTSNGGYAIKFWGGAFYIFIGGDVWKVPRNTLVPGQSLPTTPPVRVFNNPALQVVGAGVSTCAPVMGP